MTRIATPLVVPPPETRISPALYRELRAWMLENDPDGRDILEWSENLSTKNNPMNYPLSAEDMAREIIWIILCAGRKAQAARTIMDRVMVAIREGKPVVEAFGYRAKAAAIEGVWRNRVGHFDDFFRILLTEKPTRPPAEAILDWARAIPFIGEDTQYQLAKNVGIDVAKPDIWLCRLSGIADCPRRAVKLRFDACMALCRMLSEASGDSIATVDTILWLACNKGVLCVSADGGPVSFKPGPIRVRALG